jgi:hypothetical protein
LDEFWKERMTAIRVRLSRPHGLLRTDIDRLKIELDTIERTLKLARRG